jgi:hypothetical protein
MDTSNPQVLTTSANSPDTLPQRGYSCDQLARYILRQLGAPTWNVEETKQQVLDAVQDALTLFSVWRPTIHVGNVQLTKGVYQYLQGTDVEQGIVQVDFVEPNPVPTEIFYF